MISSYMTEDHRRCDDVFAEAEVAASKGDMAAARTAFERFHQMMERHLGMEERVLFPAFEQRTGNSFGPTRVMRMEHEQMRALFAEMAEAATTGNAEQYLGVAETLLVMMQQHNMKEENILYPMTQQALGPEAGEVMEQMKQSVPA